MKKIAILILLGLLMFTACEGSKDPLTEESAENSMLGNVVADFDGSELTVSLDFEKQSGWASNQFAVWVEDADGNFIKTLFATRYIANGGYKSREEALPEWVSRSRLAETEKSEIDAVSGATPAAGRLSYTWDLTDRDGNAALAGEYRIMVEGNLRWSNRVMFTAVINTAEEESSVTADAEYFYE